MKNSEKNKNEVKKKKENEEKKYKLFGFDKK